MMITVMDRTKTTTKRKGAQKMKEKETTKRKLKMLKKINPRTLRSQGKKVTMTEEVVRMQQARKTHVPLGKRSEMNHQTKSRPRRTNSLLEMRA
jgi:hypothetical protein